MKNKLLIALASLIYCAVSLAADPQVELKTTMGTIVLELYPDKAPKTVENFLQYVKEGQYKGTLFHRVIPGFMIQAGGLTDKFVEKPTRGPIKNEGSNGLKNTVGTVAMARKNEPDSATAQFYINVADNRPLDYVDEYRPGYAVFGRVIEGLDVVNKIAAVETGNGPRPYTDVPKKPIVIEDARILPAAKPAATKK